MSEEDAPQSNPFRRSSAAYGQEADGFAASSRHAVSVEEEVNPVKRISFGGEDDLATAEAEEEADEDMEEEEVEEDKGEKEEESEEASAAQGEDVQQATASTSRSKARVRLFDATPATQMAPSLRRQQALQEAQKVTFPLH